MRITDLKINGIVNPIGFAFPRVKCSWKVSDTTDQKQKNVKIEVSKQENFAELETVVEGEALSSIGTKLEISLEPYTRYYYHVEVWGDGGDHAISETAYFETGKMQEAWTAEYIGMQEKQEFHPVFTKTFTKPTDVKRARIYVTGLGLYEAYLNGKKIGDEYLAPFCNDYHKHVQYQTYDISEMLEEQNVISIYCGNGWYKGRLGYDGDVAYYGDQFGVIAEIHLWDAAGNDTVIGTDESWSYRGSDIASSDIYDGEVFDRQLWSKQENPAQPVRVLAFEKEKLIERYSLPVIEKETLPVQEVITTPKGETVLDFGQNFVGFVSFGAQLPVGTKVTLDFGEILQQGNFYNDNYRTAKSQFVYVADGRREEVRPHFTFFGFRYVRVTGWPEAVKASDFIGKVVYSDLDTTIDFTSSDEKLNRLYQNSLWGQKSNFLDMPTDCPQRDERLGWTGDAQVFTPTACFQMDTKAFYRKFLYDLHLDQMDHEGQIANYIPNLCRMPGGSSVWGDAATFIPMALYEQYGDTEELRDQYPMMKDWVEYIIRGDVEHGEEYLWNYGFHFGDWLAQDGVTPQSMKGGTDDGYVASMYYYASVQKLSKAAKILGLTEDAVRFEERAKRIYQAILAEYFTDNGRLSIDTQTGYLVSLRFGVYRDKARVIEGLKSRLKRDCYKIKGGFVGATMMCQVLAENGLEDMAYYILFQKGFPGWMHCIDLGATTIWERWNSVLDDGTISGTQMNSLNHYAYGSVMEYVYRYIAGINQTAPGFASVRFAPQISPKLSHARAAYDSVSGTYVSEWNVNTDGTVKVHFEVPFGCTAEVILPGTNGRKISIGAGEYEECYMPEIDFRQKYTMDSRLEEMKDDAEAMQILQKDLPIAAGMIAGNDVESMSMSLNELQYMFFMGFNPPMVQGTAGKLMKLKTIS